MADDLSSLLTLAELAVAFAGFSSIVVLFQNRGEGDWSLLDSIRFRMMVQVSLFAAFFATLPLPLHKLSLSDSNVWLFCSTALGAVLAIGVIVHFRGRHLFSGITDRVLWSLYHFIFWATLLAQVLNVSGFIFERESGPYLLGVSWLLFWAGHQFYRLVVPARDPAV